MTDKEDDIPVKVVDRRWWANQDGRTAPRGGHARQRQADLRRGARAADRREGQAVQEYLAKYRQAASEFEEARLRLRREISKDIERGRREILADLLEVVDNLDRAIDSARRRRLPTRCCRASRWCAGSFSRSSKGSASSGSKPPTQRVRSPRCTKRSARVPAASPDQDGLVVGVVRTATGSATTCCGRRQSRSRRAEMQPKGPRYG